MIERVRALWEKHKAVLLYLIFGGLTTVVDFAVCFLLYRLDIQIYVTSELDIYTHVADVIGWICAVLFAFVTNRVWVFESNAKGFLPVARELAAFAGGRVGTLCCRRAECLCSAPGWASIATSCASLPPLRW